MLHVRIGAHVRIWVGHSLPVKANFSQSSLLYLSFKRLNKIICKMCFDDRVRYTTRTRIENGTRIREEVEMPRHRSSWRRRYGASYYPSRYYARPPRAVRYVGGPMTYPARFPANVGYPRTAATTAMVPRGYVHGADGYMSGGRAPMPSSYNMVSLRSFL